MSAPSIGGTALTIAKEHPKCGGAYHFHRQPTHLTGAATVVRAGEQWAEWNWKALSIADFETLRTLWGNSPTQFELWSDDDKTTAVSFTSGAMLEPTYSGTFGNNWYTDVHVEFRALMPIQA